MERSHKITLLLFIASLSGCTTAPPEPIVTEKDQILFHQTVGDELAAQLDPQLDFRKDSQVTEYLQEIAQKIVDSTRSLHVQEARVFLIRGLLEKRQKIWQDYALPGGRIYLAVGTLKSMSYENEIAAEIALQLAHLQTEHALAYFRNLQKEQEALEPVPVKVVHSPIKIGKIPKAVDFFGPEGVYAFDQKQDVEATQGAVKLLYAAGYDPRGLLTVWQFYLDHPNHSPYEDPSIRKIITETRRAIAQMAPLRNPIVRTEAFIAIKKRLEGL